MISTGFTSTKVLLRVRDLDEIYGMPRPTAYRLIASGDLPSVRIGRSIRIHRDDLEEFIRRHRSVHLTDGHH